MALPTVAPGFRIPEDIANRALQHCGAKRIASFTDVSVNAAETNFAYDKVRQFELSRNIWVFATRRCYLRPTSTTNQVVGFSGIVPGAPPTMRLVPPLYNAATQYMVGAVVRDSLGQLWYSTIVDNLGNTPGTQYDATNLWGSAPWAPYYGPMSVYPWDPTVGYFSGELVYTDPGDGTYKVYMSLINNQTDNPATATIYSAAATYRKDNVVSYLGVPYISLVDLNLGNTPLTSPAQWSSTIPTGVSTGSTNWILLQGATLSNIQFVSPLSITSIGVNQGENRNVYMLPNGFLKLAPQDPKGGSTTYLGAPTGLRYNDWIREGNFIITRDVGGIFIRYVVDVIDVSTMHPMFCEGLACTLALAIAPKVTQSEVKEDKILNQYRFFMGEARLSNGIETGPTEPPEDEYISVRI